MKSKILIALAGLVLTSTVFAADGLVTLQSAHSVDETANRLVKVLNKKGMTVFTRIDHAAGAAKVDKMLRPTQVVIFGNPKVGTPLMKCAQSIAIDLPQKALIHEDAEGKVWYSYNDPKYLAKRHSMSGCEKVLMKVSGALGKFAAKATK